MIVDHPVTEKHSVFWYAAVPLMGGHGQVLTPMVLVPLTFDAATAGVRSSRPRLRLSYTPCGRLVLSFPVFVSLCHALECGGLLQNLILE